MRSARLPGPAARSGRTGGTAAKTLLGALLLMAPLAADAKTLYVNRVTGNDSTSYATNSPTAPWKTIGRAAWGSTTRESPNRNEAARAGDTVVVAAGTYSVAGPNSRNVPAYNPANAGTKGSPITFRAEGAVVLTLSGGIGTVIGSYERDYITWDGFTIREADARSHSDTGPVTLWFCNGCVLQNLDITGNGDDFGRQDNHTGIRVEWSSNILVRNNRIQNVYTAHNVNNGAAIQTYNSGGVTFEHNEIFKSGSGIFIKGGAPGGPKNDYFTIRYNLIYDIGEAEGGNGIALHVGAGNRPEAPVRIYQNIIRNVREAGIRIWMFDGRDPMMNPRNSRIVNNTIDNCGFGLTVTADLMPNAGHVFWNNIVSNSRQAAIEYGGTAAHLVKNRLDSEHNLFFKHPVFAEAATRYSFSSWKSTFGQDVASPASMERDPQYVDATAHDYRLRPTSPARNAGVDLLDLDNDGSVTDAVHLGAYITSQDVIGRIP